ncbi:MAG: substrate-binding periplasmic protein [Fusobacteriota bacterium]
MKKNVIILFFILINISFSDHISDLRIMTENYPPYNFEENGKAIGISSDLMGEMLHILDADISQDDIDVLPWARGYHIIKNSPNAVLFSTTRTNKRENHFKWVGPIIDTENVLLAKKEKQIEINSYEDINNYIVGGVTNDAAVEILLSNGVNERKIETVPDPIFNIRKIRIDRIDLIAYNKITLNWLMSESNIKLEDYEVVFSISEKSEELYYAFNKNISDEIVSKFQNALNQLKRKQNDKKMSRYEEIIIKYLKNN